MKELLKKCDLLVSNIKSDTERRQLPDLGELLIKLSVKLSDAKSELCRRKSKRDYFYTITKEQNRQYLEELEAKKEKPRKVSNVEVENMTDLMYINPQKEKIRDNLEEARQTVEYLN